MMRLAFLVSTLAFWIAVGAIGLAARLSPAPEPARLPPPAAERIIGAQELARHASPEDCWMAIAGGVYDVTDYLPGHPSEPELIMPWCGKEASEAYATKGKGRPHTPRADELLKSYRIGVFRT